MDTQELHANAYERMSVATLRKTAQGKIKNIKGMRKADLVSALIEWDAQQQRINKKSVNAIADDAPKGGTSVNAIVPEATESAPKRRTPKTQPKTQTKPSKTASSHEKTAKTDRNGKPFKSTAKPRLTVRNRCAVCGQRPIDRKTSGKDSTMCGLCFEYAGWENTHSDARHDYYLKGAKGNVDEIVDESLRSEIKECPVCQGNDPANKPVLRRNVDKTGEKKFVASKGKTKAQTFAEFAKANEWNAKIEVLENGHLERVIATARDGRAIEISWRDGACLNTGTTLREGNKTRKLRNASAAKKVLADA